MKKIRLLFLLSQVFIIHASYGQIQDYCGMSEPIQGGQNATCDCGNLSDWYDIDMLYLPTETMAPVKLRVNMIFWLREDGTGNFNNDPIENPDFYEEHDYYINELIKRFKSNYENSQLHPSVADCPSEAEYLKDSKIRFEVTPYFIKNNYAWNAENSCNGNCTIYNPNGWTNTYMTNVYDALSTAGCPKG